MNTERGEIEKVLSRINHRTGVLYDFVMVTNGMLDAIRMHANGSELTIVEIRTIMIIAENPGITATQLCQKWNRSRGAVSQILKKVSKKGFIFKKQSERDGKIWGLYTTEAGKEVAQAFIEEDFKDSTNIVHALMETCTEEELRAFYKVMEKYRRVLLERPESRWTAVN